MKTKITQLFLLFAFTALLAFTACSNGNEAPSLSLPDLTGTYTGTFENTTETITIQSGMEFEWTKATGEVFKGIIRQISASEIIFYTTHEKTQDSDWNENTSECAATYSANTIKLTIQRTLVLFSKVL